MEVLTTSGSRLSKEMMLRAIIGSFSKEPLIRAQNTLSLSPRTSRSSELRGCVSGAGFPLQSHLSGAASVS